MKNLTNEIKVTVTMTWNELVAYAKEIGVPTYHRKRVEIEADIDKLRNSYVVVDAGDMSYDRYYPGLQQKPVLNMKQGYAIINGLSQKGKTYVATRLSGCLSKHNGQRTVKLSILRGIIFTVLKATKDEYTKERIDGVLANLVSLGYLTVDYSSNNVPQFFIVKDKCNSLILNSREKQLA